MKTAFAAIFFAAFVAAANAQELEVWCRCAAFATYSDSQKMVWEGDEVSATTCDSSVNECRDACAAQINAGSNNGDLWYVTEVGTTVGQQICESLVALDSQYVHNHRIYGYFQLCGGPWEYAGVASQQSLCCTNGQQKHCINY